MKPNRMNESMIRSIAKRAIDRIQESPEREIRNLVDLGNMFACGKFQKMFFQAATEELEKETSQYYQIMTRVVRKTDRNLLLTFGMNFGYNGLTYGAEKIREFEAKEGFNVPWLFMIALSNDAPLDAQALDRLICQGTEMGICTYVLMPDPDYEKLNRLAEALAKHPDCAFLLMASAEAVMEGNLPEILHDLKHVLVGLDIVHGVPGQIADATAELRKAGMLCAAFYPASEEHLNMENAAQLAASFEYEIVFVLRDADSCLARQREIEGELIALRKELSIPVLPLDILSDAAAVDRGISSEGCLAFVSGEGNLTVINTENARWIAAGTLIESPLKDILRAALPKGVS